MVSLKEKESTQIAEEAWEAVKAILHKHNCDTGKEAKAMGMVMITFKANGSIHISTHGQLCARNAVLALIETFERIRAEKPKEELIPVG